MNSIAAPGIILSLIATLFWTISPLAFAAAGRRIGSYGVNVLRLTIASAVLTIASAIYLSVGGASLLAINPLAVFWLVASGITGLVIGDALYLQALVLLGPRSTSQLLMFTPVFSVIIGLAWQHEHFTMRVLSGMCIVVGGIAYVAGHDRKKSSAYSKEPGDFSFKGLAIGLGGAICQSMGAIFARQAFLVNPGFDPFIATAIRVMASGCIIALFSIVRNDIRRIVGTFNNSGVAKRIVAGTMAGPVLGMIAYVSAFKYAPAGVVSTLSSLMPIFIIPVVAFVYKAPVNKPALVGTAVAVTGVALMTL